jgi:O-6-methylguanine DNA methyltransferase
MKQVTEFEQRILVLLTMIPPGKVTTYGELARAAGRPKAARAVGNAIHKNPDAPTVPCHRVVKSNGEIGGYAGGTAQKVKYLAQEGVIVKEGRVQHFKEVLYKF